MSRPRPSREDAPQSPARWRVAAAVLWPAVVLALYARFALVPGLLAILGLE